MSKAKQILEKKTSVKSINKITRSMQLISTSKSQSALKKFNSYKDFYEFVNLLISKINIQQKFNYENTLWIVFFSDLGLVGSYNINIFKKLFTSLKDDDKLIIVGNKGKSISNKIKNKDISFFSFNNFVSEDNLLEIISKIKEEYFNNKHNVKVVYTKYLSQINFEPSFKTLLPIENEELEEDKTIKNIEFEPSREKILEEVIDIYLETILKGVFLETSTSEYTSRRIAMENATRNGDEILRELNIEYNRDRQSKITQEISEIVAGSEALK